MLLLKLSATVTQRGLLTRTSQQTQRDAVRETIVKVVFVARTVSLVYVIGSPSRGSVGAVAGATVVAVVAVITVVAVIPMTPTVRACQIVGAC
jgi:hypothetical protein